MEHPTAVTLEAALDDIRRSPSDQGRVHLIVRRPAENAREVISEARLDRDQGLVGDTWRVRPSNLTRDRSPHPDLQLTLMNCRVAALVAGGDERRPLAGDQLYVDLDLSEANLPPGTRLTLGSAVIEISDKPHRGCQKFADRFGQEALMFVNSAVGRALRLRGVNARIVVTGTVRLGDQIEKRTEAATSSGSSSLQERIARQDHVDRVQRAARRVATQHREILDRLKNA
jgi:hypothetical protein